MTPTAPQGPTLRERKGIPFTQYLMPDGRKDSVWIERAAEVEALAFSVIASGLAFECEMLSDYRTISLTVTDGEDDVEIELCANGPDVPNAVDRLVRRAALLRAASPEDTNA